MREKVFGHSLLVGVLLLTLVSVTTIFLLFSLENEMKLRNKAILAQNQAEEVDRALMEWMIFRLLAETSQEDFRNSGLSRSLEKKIKSIQRELEKTVLHDPIQLRRTLDLKNSWTHFVENLHDQKSRAEIRHLIHEIESYEQDKVDQYAPIINYKIKIMTLVSGLLLFISLFIVVHSFKNLKRKKLQQEEIIRRLEDAKKAADESSQLKSKFVATVSHEIRTPINGIVGASEILKKHEFNETQSKLVKVIYSSSKTLLNLVNELLDFSKLESKNISVKPTPIDLYDLISQIIESMNWKAEEKSLYLYTDIDFDVPQYVEADENLLRQVLVNLIGNALKFTFKGRVVLKVQKYLKGNNDHIKFIIEDTGIGISAEEQKSIFNPFFQTQGVGDNTEPGTGIGLTISQRLVRAMGGEIAVESVPNKGTRFFFDLDLNVISESKLRTQSPFRSIRSNTLSGLNILVAEDNLTNQIVCTEILQDQGAKVIIASNGREALDQVSKYDFDLILMDCQMPQLSGYQAATAIRSKKINTPIIALTANVSEENQIRCKKAGMDVFVGKPLAIGDLIEKISTVLPKVKNRVSAYNLKNQVSEEVRQKIVKAYLLTLSDLEQKLSHASKLSNSDQLNQIGHQFKSSSKLLGETDLVELFSELESEKDITQARILSRKISNRIPETISRLEISN